MEAQPHVSQSTDPPFTQEMIDEILKEGVAASLAPATKESYRYRNRMFERHCEMRGLLHLPADPQVVANYLAIRSTTIRPKCVGTDRSAIRHNHRTNGYADPTATELISRFMAGLGRIHGTAYNKKIALATTAIRAMCLNFDVEGGAMAIRNKAVILVGYAGALRADEVVTRNIGDLEFCPEGVAITIRKSKTDQEAQGQEVAISNGEHPETDPVLGLKEWLETYSMLLGRELLADDPVFPAMARVGDPVEKRVVMIDTGMTKYRYRKILKEAAEKIGIDPKDVSGHSCRRGHATEAARNGAHRGDIAKQGRWKSTQVMDGYIAEGRRFEDNSSRHLGL